MNSHEFHGIIQGWKWKYKETDQRSERDKFKSSKWCPKETQR